MKTDYKVRAVELEIDNNIYHIFLKKKGRTIIVTDIFKKVNNEILPCKFTQKQLMDLSIRNILKSIKLDVRRYLKRLSAISKP